MFVILVLKSHAVLKKEISLADADEAIASYVDMMANRNCRSILVESSISGLQCGDPRTFRMATVFFAVTEPRLSKGSFYGGLQ